MITGSFILPQSRAARVRSGRLVDLSNCHYLYVYPGGEVGTIVHDECV